MYLKLNELYKHKTDAGIFLAEERRNGWYAFRVIDKADFWETDYVTSHFKSTWTQGLYLCPHALNKKSLDAETKELFK